MNSNCDFDKKLAKIQVAFTALITIGSILIAIGVSSLDFSSTLSLDAADKQKDVAQFLQQLSNVRYVQGLLYTVAGVLILTISIPICLSKINELKCDESDRINHDNQKDDKGFRSDNTYEKRLQESLENVRLQLQIEELKLEITKLKIQVESETLNQVKHKGKMRDSKRK